MGKKLTPGGKPLRIAYGRVFHEGNSYSPLFTEREQFEAFHFFEGQELSDFLASDKHELVDILRKAELRGCLETAEKAGDVECVPLISALAVPGGPISSECFEWVRERLKNALRNAGELDGVYLALHGSMRVAGLDAAPESVLIADVKEVLGDAIAIAVSYDLHANLAPSIVDTTTILEGYRTNPHRDLRRTGIRATTQLIQHLRSVTRPVRAWRKLPVILGGGMTIDFLNPMRPLFMHIKKLCKRHDVISAHIFMVHPFTDAEDLGWAVHVCTDGDQALADRLADELADMVWKVREVPLPEFQSPADALREVRKAKLARKLGHVSLVDTSDVVGAGATGGNTHLLDTLVKEGSDLMVLVPLHDPAAVEELWSKSVGNQIEVTLRGTEGLAAQPEVKLSATIDKRVDGDFGRTLVLRHNELRVAVTEKSPGPVHPKFWRQLGLSPWKADAIVQKFFFHYRIFYAASLRKNIPVATMGPSSLERVRDRKFDLPTYPRDAVAEWQSFDQARRAELRA